MRAKTVRFLRRVAAQLPTKEQRIVGPDGKSRTIRVLQIDEVRKAWSEIPRRYRGGARRKLEKAMALPTPVPIRWDDFVAGRGLA